MVVKQVDVVGAVIRNPAGEVLCARRSERMSIPLLWEFPGGKVEPGEEPRATLRREVGEELGCEVEVGELVADATHDYPGLTVRLITYECRVVAGVLEPREHAELRWVSPERLGELDWAPADLPTVARLTEQEIRPSPQPCRPSSGTHRRSGGTRRRSAGSAHP